MQRLLTNSPRWVISSPTSRDAYFVSLVVFAKSVEQNSASWGFQDLGLILHFLSFRLPLCSTRTAKTKNPNKKTQTKKQKNKTQQQQQKITLSGWVPMTFSLALFDPSHPHTVFITRSHAHQSSVTQRKPPSWIEVLCFCSKGAECR